MNDDISNPTTELIRISEARFPRSRLRVIRGPDKGAEVGLEGQTVMVGSEEGCQLRLTDPAVSRQHFELTGGPGGYRLKDKGSTNGVFIDSVQVVEAKLSEKAIIRLGRTELCFEPERQQIHWPLSATDRFGDCYGRSTAMRRLFALLEKAAPTESPIVLEGEPGTGKEALARAIHQNSPRNEGPFAVMDFGAVNPELIESDLFGHELSHVAGPRKAKLGAFEEANGGTLFLDEIQELSPAHQLRLLRALESLEIKRQGGTNTIKISVRVVAASRKDLDAEVKAGRFREDLFFKLSVFRMRVPSLRERLDDIPQLARIFEQKIKNPTPLNPESLDMLQRHEWSNNVRELRNVVERLCAMPDLGAAAVAKALGKGPEVAEDPKDKVELSRQLLALPYHEAKDKVLESFEKSYFVEHLRAASGVVTKAAKRVGLPRQSVHRMLRRLGLHAGEE